MTDSLKKVLIVDDSETDREILKSIVGTKYAVIEAANGYIALEILLKSAIQVDLILLDVSMPVLDGFDVLRIMREKKLDDIPVFLITAEATKDNVEKAAPFRISEFIAKPFDRREIMRRLAAKLETTGLREDDDFLADILNGSLDGILDNSQNRTSKGMQGDTQDFLNMLDGLLDL